MSQNNRLGHSSTLRVRPSQCASPQKKIIICEFIANDVVELNDMNLTNTRTTLFVVGRQLSTSDSTQAPNFEAPMSYKQK